MRLVFGGAYQGKLDWARENIYAEESPKLFCCDENSAVLDLDTDIISGLHLYILALLRRGDDPVEHISKLLPRLVGKTLICDDITCGVVPMGAESRAHREAVGRVLSLLGREAAAVTRVFCGIGTTLKP